MRRHSFLQKSRLLLQPSSTTTHGVVPHLARHGLSAKCQRRVGPTSLRRHTRQLSTVAPGNIGLSSEPGATEASGQQTQEAGPSVEPPPEPPVNNLEDQGRPAVKARRTRSTNVKEPEPVELPDGIQQHVLYEPSSPFSQNDTLQGALPPPEIFEEALDKLLITFHPQNQARSLAVSSSSSRPVEPTLGLYCPFEGGDFILDMTVHELAYRTGAEILTLDTVQLAAGEWGIFGKGIGQLQVLV